MRGHQALIKMRKSGSVPDIVWIDTWADYMPMADDWMKMNNAHAHLQVDPDDRIERLDMRCVHGLVCKIDGDEEKQVNAMRDACIRVGAKRVIASVMDRFGKDEFIAYRVKSLTDTEGFLGPKPGEVDG